MVSAGGAEYKKVCGRMKGCFSDQKKRMKGCFYFAVGGSETLSSTRNYLSFLWDNDG